MAKLRLEQLADENRRLKLPASVPQRFAGLMAESRICHGAAALGRTLFFSGFRNRLLANFIKVTAMVGRIGSLSRMVPNNNFLMHRH